MIEMALKLLFMPQNHQNRPAAGGSVPPCPSVIRLSYISLFSTGPKLESFAQKILLLVWAPSFLTKFWLRFWSHSLLQTDVSSDYSIMGRIQNKPINAAGLIRLFLDMNAKFLKQSKNCSRKISFFTVLDFNFTDDGYSKVRNQGCPKRLYLNTALLF